MLDSNALSSQVHLTKRAGSFFEWSVLGVPIRPLTRMLKAVECAGGVDQAEAPKRVSVWSFAPPRRNQTVRGKTKTARSFPLAACNSSDLQPSPTLRLGRPTHVTRLPRRSQTKAGHMSHVTRHFPSYGAIRSARVSVCHEQCSRSDAPPPVFFAWSASEVVSLFTKSSQVAYREIPTNVQAAPSRCCIRTVPATGSPGVTAFREDSSCSRCQIGRAHACTPVT